MDAVQSAVSHRIDAPLHWPSAGASDHQLVEPLTERERHFLDCLAGGASNKEIARQLQVSENTVKFHLKNVYSKFAVRSRTQAVRAAVALGMLPTAAGGLSS